MLSAAELAAKALISAEDHRRAAKTLRRLAGGLKAQSGGPLALSDREKSVLSDAIKLLDQMASVSDQAGKQVAKRLEGEAKHRAELLAAIQLRFGGLSSIADRVAFIGAVNSSVLRQGHDSLASHPDMLLPRFKEAIESLSWRLAGEGTGRRPAEIAEEAWLKFQGGRAAIENQHAQLIVALQRLNGR